MYQGISTPEVVKMFENLGMKFHSDSWAKVRDKSKDGSQKHLVRLNVDTESSGQETLQVLITNSYDAKQAFKIDLGFFRFACANGLVVGTGFDSIRILHRGKTVQEQVRDAVSHISTMAPNVQVEVDRLKGIRASAAMTQELVSRANLALGVNTDLRLQIDRKLRREDRAQDLWTVFNVVQERVVKGLYHFENSKGSLVKARAIKSVDRNMKLNKELWNSMLLVS